ncbi:hypothetical protein ACFE3N_29590 (plasmid) [Streptomyces albidoflavus]|uniref:hypothetical protein n=1 Tax=Streptomyces TaxID=1883 RepID=UPI00069108BD|nr:hypothetical protein [Streptomyces sp. CNQ431]
MPLLFIEVDNCHETAEKPAAKLEKCARFFRRTSKDTDGKERPMWRAPAGPSPSTRTARRRTRPCCWCSTTSASGTPTAPSRPCKNRPATCGRERQRGGHHLYDRKIPIIAVVLTNLREHGPAGPVFLRFGRDHLQPLLHPTRTDKPRPGGRLGA